jgi:hypothetical protein
MMSVGPDVDLQQKQQKERKINTPSQLFSSTVQVLVFRSIIIIIIIFKTTKGLKFEPLSIIIITSIIYYCYKLDAVTCRVCTTVPYLQKL